MARNRHAQAETHDQTDTQADVDTLNKDDTMDHVHTTPSFADLFMALSPEDWQALASTPEFETKVAELNDLANWPNIARTVKIRVAGKDTNPVDVEITSKFHPGMIHTPISALLAQRHVEQQFYNNMNANADNRAKRFAKDGKAEDAPYTVSELQAIWPDYMPDVGGSSERQSQDEKDSVEAKWKAWVTFVTGHNAAIDRGEVSPYRPKLTIRAEEIPSGKGKTKAGGKSLSAYKEEAIKTVSNALEANKPLFMIELYEKELAKIKAARGIKLATATAAVASPSVNMFDAFSLDDD